MSKLTAKDLMVGDYVQFPKTNHIFKVQTISGGEQDTLHYVTAKNVTGDFLSRSEWEGVPLTPEILEKNGFVNVYRGRYRFDDNKGSIVEVNTINGVIKWIRVSKYDSDDIEDTLAHFTSYEIKHLHELQNTLKLCGINKEIEL